MYAFRKILRMNSDHVQSSTNQLFFVMLTKYFEVKTTFQYIKYTDTLTFYCKQSYT
jgi:hypothetical protein